MTSLPKPPPIGKEKTHLTGYYSTERGLHKVKKAYRTGGGGSGKLASPAGNVRNQELSGAGSRKVAEISGRKLYE